MVLIWSRRPLPGTQRGGARNSFEGQYFSRQSVTSGKSILVSDARSYRLGRQGSPRRSSPSPDSPDDLGGRLPWGRSFVRTRAEPTTPSPPPDEESAPGVYTYGSPPGSRMRSRAGTGGSITPRSRENGGAAEIPGGRRYGAGGSFCRTSLLLVTLRQEPITGGASWTGTSVSFS